MRLFQEAVGWEWRRWFAWRPVRTQHYEWVWLEFVARKYYLCPIESVFPSSWIIYQRESGEDANEKSFKITNRNINEPPV